MKTKFLNTLLICVLSLTLTNSHASGNADPIVSQLKQQIRFPEELKSMNSDATVYVSFTVDESGHISVLNTNASHPSADRDVAEQLELISINATDIHPGEIYYVKINFKLIN
jgi:hypothetical protein